MKMYLLLGKKEGCMFLNQQTGICKVCLQKCNPEKCPVWGQEDLRELYKK